MFNPIFRFNNLIIIFIKIMCKGHDFIFFKVIKILERCLNKSQYDSEQIQFDTKTLYRIRYFIHIQIPNQLGRRTLNLKKWLFIIQFILEIINVYENTNYPSLQLYKNWWKIMFIHGFYHLLLMFKKKKYLQQNNVNDTLVKSIDKVLSFYGIKQTIKQKENQNSQKNNNKSLLRRSINKIKSSINLGLGSFKSIQQIKQQNKKQQNQQQQISDSPNKLAQSILIQHGKYLKKMVLSIHELQSNGLNCFKNQYKKQTIQSSSFNKLSNQIINSIRGLRKLFNLINRLILKFPNNQISQFAYTTINLIASETSTFSCPLRYYLDNQKQLIQKYYDDQIVPFKQLNQFIYDEKLSIFLHSEQFIQFKTLWMEICEVRSIILIITNGQRNIIHMNRLKILLEKLHLEDIRYDKIRQILGLERQIQQQTQKQNKIIKSSFSFSNLSNQLFKSRKLLQREDRQSRATVYIEIQEEEGEEEEGESIQVESSIFEMNNLEQTFLK